MLLLVVAGCLATSALAGESWVIAAGVDKYEDAEISSLNYAVADVAALADAFRATGVPADHILLLTSDAKDISQQPRRSTILRVLQKVRERCDTEDTVLFFFSGHGMEKDGQAFLLTLEANRELLAETALPMSMVNSIAAGFLARSTLFVIDACRNDPDAGRANADASMGDAFVKGVRPRMLRGSAVLFACGVGQRAWEMPDSGHGAFTHFLLQGLAGAARAEDGSVRLSSLAEYVVKEVPSWSERSKHPAQTPYLDNPEKVDIVLVQPGAQAVATGEVLVRSQPDGARIVFRGQALGTTPATVRLPPGEQTLTLKREGCEDATVRVTVRAKETAQTELARLAPIPGTVRVTTEPPVIGHLAWDIVDCVTSKKIGSGSRDVKLSDVVIDGRPSRDEREMYNKKVALDHGFALCMAEFPEKSAMSRVGFGLLGDKEGENTFCWDWFTVDRASHATKLQEKGELEFSVAKVGDGWQLAHMKFLTDVSIRINRRTDDPGAAPRWRVNIHKGSEIDWPALVGGEIRSVAAKP
ncbi:MAG: caspase family protein [Armatimonadetes bacterium]|nr:caspase family protein [Armatimonadota bacterium]